MGAPKKHANITCTATRKRLTFRQSSSEEITFRTWRRSIRNTMGEKNTSAAVISITSTWSTRSAFAMPKVLSSFARVWTVFELLDVSPASLRRTRPILLISLSTCSRYSAIPSAVPAAPARTVAQVMAWRVLWTHIAAPSVRLAPTKSRLSARTRKRSVYSFRRRRSFRSEYSSHFRPSFGK